MIGSDLSGRSLQRWIVASHQSSVCVSSDARKPATPRRRLAFSKGIKEFGADVQRAF
jgi:hypothetical protein